MGSTQEDIQGDIDYRQTLIEKRQRKIEKSQKEGGFKPYIDRQIRLRDADIEMQRKMQEYLSEMQDKGILKTSGFIPFMQRKEGYVPDNSFSFGGPMYKGGMAKQGQVGLVGELGPELMIPRTDAQIFSARRTEEMIMSALARGMGGGGESVSPTIITDNSIRSNTSNMISSPSMITSNDSLMNSITNSV